MEERIYKSLLIKESDNIYLGPEPTHNPNPDLPDIGPGMYEVDWNKPISDEILQAEHGTYKYENNELIQA